MTTIRVQTFSKGVPLLVAVQRGILERAGLQVAWERTRSSAEQMRALLAGDLDVIHTAADNVMAAQDRGGDGSQALLFFVGDLTIEHVLVVGPRVRSFEDLRGTVLGADAPDTGYAIVLRKLLRDHGLGEADYRLQAIGSTPMRLEALRSGAVSGCMLQVDPTEVEDLRVLARARDVYPRYPGTTAATTRRWAAGNEHALADYTRALVQGTRWALDPNNRDDLLRLVADDLGMDAAVARRRVEALAPVPTVEEATDGLRVVRALRDEVLGADRSTAIEVFWEPRFQAEALRTAAEPNAP